MDMAAGVVLVLIVTSVVAAVVRGRDPEVRARYDRWGVGHGRFSGRVRGWTGADDGPDGP